MIAETSHHAAIESIGQRLDTAQRLDTIDIVKALAIILVAVGHTAQGLFHRGWWATPSFFFTDRYIYSFHMAAFFFVAGLFAAQSLAKRGAWSFTLQKLGTLIYPYVLWAVLYRATAPFTQHWRSGGTQDWHSFLFEMLRGDTGWFLITLFVC